MRFGYDAQVRLLLQCLPFLNNHPDFALKGGTAINLFVHNMPRISVDIDLPYVPITRREEALAAIETELNALRSSLLARVPRITVQGQHTAGRLLRLLVSNEEATVKLEPNAMFRGTVHPKEQRDLCTEAQEHFQVYARAQLLSIADLYGGKLCAALDRQHPRDLYDVKLLLDGTGITPAIRRAFVVYLAGHNRPIHELLAPRLADITTTYRTQSAGMTRDEVPLEDLITVQEQLPGLILSSLNDDERAFLLSLKRGVPEWHRLGLKHVSELPALQWKLLNVQRMDKAKHVDALRKLETVLAR